ncbi:MAG: FAD-dependent oxidoreductase, partial [Mycobacteriaceae bacterium]
GILISTGEDLRAKAFTLSTNKWSHLDREHFLLRVSFGRFGESGIVDSGDNDLIAYALEDLAIVSGTQLHPVDAVVQRWPGGLPQYGVGHDHCVSQIKAHLPRGIAVAGAMMEGVGVPACIASGRAAATQIIDWVAR